MSLKKLVTRARVCSLKYSILMREMKMMSECQQQRQVCRSSQVKSIASSNELVWKIHISAQIQRSTSWNGSRNQIAPKYEQKARQKRTQIAQSNGTKATAIRSPEQQSWLVSPLKIRFDLGAQMRLCIYFKNEQVIQCGPRTGWKQK